METLLDFHFWCGYKKMTDIDRNVDWFELIFNKSPLALFRKMFMMPRRYDSLFDSDDFLSNLKVQRQQLGCELDVRENDKQYTVVVDLPGFKQENLNIEVTDENMVHIHAKRESEEAKEGEKYIVKERSAAEFTRAFRLPKDVKHTEVNASFENGVLQLEIPKAEKQIPQRSKV